MALRKSGKTYAEIAAIYGCHPTLVYQHVAEISGTGPRVWNKATLSDQSFIRAGAAPIEHRDTGKGGVEAFKADAAGWFHVEPTTIDECADLLKEWGAS